MDIKSVATSAGAGDSSFAVTRNGPAAGSQAQNDDTASGSPSPGGALSPWATRGVFRNRLTSDSSSAGMTSSSECCPRLDAVNRHNAIVKREMQHGHCNYKKAGQDIMKQLADFQFKSPFLLGDGEPSASTDHEKRTHDSHSVFGVVNLDMGLAGTPEDDIVFVATAGILHSTTSTPAPNVNYHGRQTILSRQQDDTSRPWANSSGQSAQRRISCPGAIEGTSSSRANGKHEFGSAVSPLALSEKWQPVPNFDEGMQWCKSLIKAPAHVHCADSSYSQDCTSGRSCYAENGKLRSACDEHETISLATFLYNLGKCEEMQGHFDIAMKYNDEALQALEGVLSTWPRVAVRHTDVTHLKLVLQMSMGQIKFQQKIYDEAKEHFRTALAVTQSTGEQQKQQCPPSHYSADGIAHTAAALMNCLGIVSYYSEGDRELLASNRDNDTDHSDEVVSSCSGDWLQKALTIRRRLLGSSSSPEEVATTLNNLGRVHHLQESYSQAKPEYEESLRIRKFFLGSTHPDAGATMFNLGELERHQGNDARAKARHEEFLKLIEQHVDQLDDHEVPEAWYQMMCVSNMYLADCDLFYAQNFDRAAKLYFKALKAEKLYFEALQATIAPTILPTQNQHNMVISGIWNKIGHCWFQLGKWSGAVRAYEVVLEDEEDVLELQPQLLSDSMFLENRLITLRQLAEAHTNLAIEAAGAYDHEMEQDCYAAALMRYEQVFELQEQQAIGRPLYESVGEMANTLLCRASLHFKRESTTNDGGAKALECFDLAKQLHGRSVDLELAHFRSQAGAMLAKAAVEQFVNVQDMVLFDLLTDLAFQELNDSSNYLYRLSSETITAAQNEAIVSNLNHMGVIYRYKGNYRRALAILVRSEQVGTSFVGNDFTTSLIRTRSNIADLYLESENFQQAYKIYQSVLPAQVRAFGEVHEDVVRTRSKLAELYRETGNLEMALEECESVLQLHTRILGSTYHVEVGDTLLVIADVYMSRGNIPHMKQSYDLAVHIYDRLEIQTDEIESRLSVVFKWGKPRRKYPPAAAAA
jgi:tetratricopeptide (TPR) repeat protein